MEGKKDVSSEQLADDVLCSHYCLFSRKNCEPFATGTVTLFSPLVIVGVAVRFDQEAPASLGELSTVYPYSDEGH